MSDFDLEDFRTYADRHRGRNVRSGPHWPLVMRYPVLFDAYEKLLARALTAERELAELKERTRRRDVTAILSGIPVVVSEFIPDGKIFMSQQTWDRTMKPVQLYPPEAENG